MSQKTLLILTQVFLPDPASVGQHVADVAFEMARRGHGVQVYTSARGYEDPTIRYPARERMRSVCVRRLPFVSFGKQSIVRRVLGAASFMAQALVLGLLAPDVAGVFFSTSPPLIGLVANLVGRLRGVPVVYWAMDLNPDQIIALGKLNPRAPAARLLEAINRVILRHSTRVVALDRFMAARIQRRGGLRGKMRVMPPWPHEDQIDPASSSPTPALAEAAANPFRERHRLAGKFIVMYSGNHSPSNPLRTLLDAARHFKDDPHLRFLFIGGGTGKKQVEAFVKEHALSNALCLPYQPLAELRHSLTAADVHVVSLGDAMVGILHPCKIYGAMAAGRPVLYLGPRPSHITDLLDACPFGWQVRHGDVAATIAALDEMRRTPPADLRAMGDAGRRALREKLSQTMLCAAFCDDLEAVIYGPRSPARK